MNEIELIICITITALVAFFVLKKKEKKNKRDVHSYIRTLND